MSRPIDDYLPYVELTSSEIYDRLDEIEIFLRKYAAVAKIDFNKIVCRREVLLDIIERVEKRRVYFKVFHDIEMSEKKEASLYCFWIIKLAPFFYAMCPENQINVRFAAYLFVSVIGRIASEWGHGIKLDEKYLYSLFYSFTYRDLSKEAIMDIAETLLI